MKKRITLINCIYCVFIFIMHINFILKNLKVKNSEYHYFILTFFGLINVSH